MANLTASYETVMILSTKDRDEAEVTSLCEKFKKLISDNGTIVSVDEWGKRRLAYPINYETEGYYVLINFTCDANFPAELDRVYKINDGILRSLIIKKED